MNALDAPARHSSPVRTVRVQSAILPPGTRPNFDLPATFAATRGIARLATFAAEAVEPRIQSYTNFSLSLVLYAKRF